ncbi:MAG: hypothetical protein MUD01_12060 [Chloroflexaceae bacterium]|nr:hypothetical protein [Chloroflexaceae bacterium]
MQTLRSSGNTWFASEARPFGLTSSKGYSEQWDFAGWKDLTKQDSDSRFQNPGLTCTVASNTPPTATPTAIPGTTPTPTPRPAPAPNRSGVFLPLVRR